MSQQDTGFVIGSSPAFILRVNKETMKFYKEQFTIKPQIALRFE